MKFKAVRPLITCLVFILCQSVLGAKPTTSPSKCDIGKSAPMALQPFPLGDVQLLPGPCLHAREMDQKYLVSLDPNRLLYNFRVNAGLPAPGKPLGGWEAPNCELRGHFEGHYLSACAHLFASTKNPAIKKRADYLVNELDKCQKALGGEYLSAFPTSFFDRLEAGKPVWAPYYTIHKIMQGLLDMYRYCGNKRALRMAERMADYFEKRDAKISQSIWVNKVLTVEFGGMPDTLYLLYSITHRPADLTLAHRFDQKSFLDPLMNHQDDLTGIHANTHIPKILGAARRYELFDDTPYRRLTEYFWERIANHRSYATGGSNEGEFWGTPDKLANTLVSNNEETCTTYNILKVTRDLIRWTANPKYADFYERAYWNGILPAQNPNDGMMIYYLPLASGFTKAWGTPYDSFWCCYGTGVESFAKLNDSIYFHNSNSLYVNLYVTSTVNWKAKGIKLIQDTVFPVEQGSKFTIRVRRPASFDLRLHVPYWVGNRCQIFLDGKRLHIPAKPTSYASINRTWRNGDQVRIVLPMTLHASTMPDNPDMKAMMYGPLVLAGVTDRLRFIHGDGATFVYRITSDNPNSWLKPVKGSPLTFTSVGQPEQITFLPLYKIVNQHYAVYWSFAKPNSPLFQRAAEEAKLKAEMEKRIVDKVLPNNPESEKAHNLQSEESGAGVISGYPWRDGRGYFQWDLKVLPDVPMTLLCQYWGPDSGRVFDITVDGVKIATQSLNGGKPEGVFDVTYPIPQSLTQGKTLITVRFTPHPGSIAGGVFGCATLKPAEIK